MSDFRANLVTALAAAHTTVVYIQTDPTAPGPPTSAWWDVPVAEVSELASVAAARAGYEAERQAQRSYLSPSRAGESAAEAGAL